MGATLDAITKDKYLEKSRPPRPKWARKDNIETYFLITRSGREIIHAEQYVDS